MLARASLETLIPLPRRREIDHVDLAAPPSTVWSALNDGDVVWPSLVRAIAGVRMRAAGLQPRRVRPGPGIGSLRSTVEQPGFHFLGGESERSLTVGAVAAMRVVTFEFLPLSGPETFEQLRHPGFVKLAWRMSVVPLGTTSSRLHFELRLDATDELSWRRFRRAYSFLGPLARLVRRRVLASLADEFGAPELSALRRAQGVASNSADSVPTREALASNGKTS
jgi:hypothetical protein